MTEKSQTHPDTDEFGQGYGYTLALMLLLVVFGSTLTEAFIDGSWSPLFVSLLITELVAICVVAYRYYRYANTQQ